MRKIRSNLFAQIISKANECSKKKYLKKIRFYPIFVVSTGTKLTEKKYFNPFRVLKVDF